MRIVEEDSESDGSVNNKEIHTGRDVDLVQFEEVKLKCDQIENVKVCFNIHVIADVEELDFGANINEKNHNNVNKEMVQFRK